MATKYQSPTPLTDKSPDELLAEGLAVQDSAVEKLVALGLTEQEARSLISINLADYI